MKGYDPRCRNLAAIFIDGHLRLSPEDASDATGELAQHIQDAIEDWLRRDEFGALIGGDRRERAE